MMRGTHASHGSSPRGRGTRRASYPRAAAARFIPARAGNACPGSPRALGATVHPRAGGERPRCSVTAFCAFGSSPRGRGTPHAGRRRAGRRRFIPARAGNARQAVANRGNPTVHPRAGGERALPAPNVVGANGSSPRGRGTRRRKRIRRLARRFIPARAGNARRPSPSPCSSSVHPRAGGERSAGSVKFTVAFGSSPRGRGTLAVGELEDPPNIGVPPTARCCGAAGIVRRTACACAHRRQGASLRSAPASRGFRP